MKNISASDDLQQSGIEGDEGVHDHVATKENVGQVPSQDELSLTATRSTLSRLFSSVGKKVCESACFQCGLYPIHPLSP